jgi:hypothetical protein
MRWLPFHRRCLYCMFHSASEFGNGGFCNRG